MNANNVGLFLTDRILHVIAISRNDENCLVHLCLVAFNGDIKFKADDSAIIGHANTHTCTTKTAAKC